MSYEDIGDVQNARGDIAGTMKSYREDLSIAERLAKSDPGNAGWQSDLSISYEKIGEVELAQGDFAGARVAFENAGTQAA